MDRAYFERRLGADFSAIRLHDDAAAGRAARNLGASAFTYGSDIAFAPGALQPDTDAGRGLLIHELTHTLEPDAGAIIRCQPDTESEVPFGPQLPSADAVSGVGGPLLSHPLSDYPILFGALIPDDYIALEAAMRRRDRVVENGGAGEPPSGAFLVQTPLEELVHPALRQWRSHDEMLEAVFERMCTDAASAEVGAQEIATNDALRLYMEPRLFYDVDILLDDPDGLMGGSSRLIFKVGQTDLGSTDGEISVDSLDRLPGMSLADATARAGLLAGQAGEAARLLGEIDNIIAKVQESADGIAKQPEDFAINDVRGLMRLSALYLQRLEAAAKLHPENAYLDTWMQGAVERFTQTKQAMRRAMDIADQFFIDNEIPKAYGAVYTDAEDEYARDFDRKGGAGKALAGANWFATKAFHFVGDALSIGSLSRRERNYRTYQSGQISYNAWQNNEYWDFGKGIVLAAVTALTAGIGEGFAVGLLGVGEGTAAAVFVEGAQQGFIGGFVTELTSDAYSGIVSLATSDPGVAAYNRSAIGGPAAWFHAGLQGATIGGPFSLAVRVGAKALGGGGPAELGSEAGGRTFAVSEADDLAIAGETAGSAERSTAATAMGETTVSRLDDGLSVPDENAMVHVGPTELAALDQGGGALAANPAAAVLTSPFGPLFTVLSDITDPLTGVRTWQLRIANGDLYTVVGDPAGNGYVHSFRTGEMWRFADGDLGNLRPMKALTEGESLAGDGTAGFSGDAPASFIVADEPAMLLDPEAGPGIDLDDVAFGPREPLALREGSSAIGRLLSNDSLNKIQERYGPAVRQQTELAATRADLNTIAHSLGTRSNVYLSDVSELAVRDVRQYRGELAIRPRATGTTPGMDLLSIIPGQLPELVVPEVKAGASKSVYRIGRSNMPNAYHSMEQFYREIYEIVRDKSIPVGIRARIKLAVDEGRVRWELDAVGNVKAKMSGTEMLPGDITVNFPIDLPK